MCPYITFTPDDMQVKGKHDRPLYFTGYIGLSEVSHVQVDPVFTLSIMPRGSCSTWESPLIDWTPPRLSSIGFNANSTRLMGKVKLKCQIGGLRSEVTCYVIDANTSYNLLLGRPLIHHFIVSSTLHQVMKYAVGDRKSSNVDRREASIQGVENYFTSSFTRILWKQTRFLSQRNHTLVMKLMSSQRQKKNVFDKLDVNNTLMM